MEHKFKVIIVGDVATGKTSFLKTNIDGVFYSNYKATTGVDFYKKEIEWLKNLKVELELWDIAGQERFRSMTRTYYKNASGAIVIFDISRKSTFDAVVKWKGDIDSKIYLDEDKKIPVILVGAKLDLHDPNEEDDEYLQIKENMINFCKIHGFVTYVEISAKNKLNLDYPFNSLVTVMLDNIPQEPKPNVNQAITLDVKPEKGGCC